MEQSHLDQYPHTAGYRFTEDGDYSITFSGKDASGNVANTVTRNFKIDKVAPELTIKATKNDTTEPVENYGSVGNVQNPEKVKLTIGVKETFYTGDEVTVSVKKNGANEPAKTYKGITGQVIDFAEDGVLNIAYDYHPRGNGTNGYYRYFCTTDLQPVPIEGDYDFLGYGNGYYLFAHEVGDDHNQRYVQLYDSDFNLVYDSTGAYDLQNWGPCNIYLNTGWMPGEKLATGEEGYFNLFTQKWRALPSGQDTKSEAKRS